MFRSCDLGVMSPARCLCAMSVIYNNKQIFKLFSFILIKKVDLFIINILL